jgi:acetylornithine deacetylase/succinyl-diaminopimelate desuccinylase
MATMIHGPLTIDHQHPVVKSAQRALADCGLPPDRLTVFPAWTDGALLSREGKIPTIIWGPGELNYAHSPEENILLADVHLAVKLYAATALDFSRPR